MGQAGKEQSQAQGQGGGRGDHGRSASSVAAGRARSPAVPRQKPSARFSPGGWLSDVWEAFEQRRKVTEKPLPLLFAVHPLTPSLGWAFPTELERKNSEGFSEQSGAVLRKEGKSK